MPFLLHIVWLFSWLPLSLGQEYPIPSHWANISSTLSRIERTQLAQAVIDTVSFSYDDNTGQISNLGFGQNANLLSAMAIHDALISGRYNYKTVTEQYLLTMPRLIPQAQGLVSNDPLMWGLTAIYAYRAYQEGRFLSNAIAIWEEFTTWAITPTQAESGTHLLKNATFHSECNGGTVAGSVFYKIHDDHDLGVTAGTVGAYMALSAYLYEITQNQTYYDWADLTRVFIQARLYDDTYGYVRDSMSLSNCHYDNKFVLTYNSGLYLEGLSVFASTTNDSTLIDEADQLAFRSVTLPNWTDTTGVISEALSNANDNSDFAAAYKGMLIRALSEHLSRKPRNSDIAKVIEAFLTVQHNALINNARFPGTNWYTPLWLGPAVPQMFPWGQLAAIDALNSVISLAEEPSLSPMPTSTPPVAVHKKPHVGIIVGATIGGFLFAIILMIIIYFVLSRRWHRCREGHGSSQAPRKSRALISVLGVTKKNGRAVEPFPPSFPEIELAHSSKLHDELRHPPTTRPLQPPSESQAPSSSMNPDSSRESVQELLQRLTQALSRRYGPAQSMNSRSSVAPPQY